MRAFLDNDAGARFAHDPDAWFLLDALVDYRCDYHGGDPLRWSGGAIELFLLDFVPRKLAAPEDLLARATEILRAWMPWAAARAGLPDSVVVESLEAVDELADEFRQALPEPSRWGPAKGLAMDMLEAGVDPSDSDAANSWLRAHVRS